MIVKVYTYRIPIKNVKDWKTIHSKASRLYKKHGNPSFIVLTKKYKRTMTVMDTEIYKTGKEFNNVFRKASCDAEIKSLYSSFLMLVEGKVAEEI